MVRYKLNFLDVYSIFIQFKDTANVEATREDEQRLYPKNSPEYHPKKGKNSSFKTRVEIR